MEVKWTDVDIQHELEGHDRHSKVEFVRRVDPSSRQAKAPVGKYVLEGFQLVGVLQRHCKQHHRFAAQGERRKKEIVFFFC